MNNNLFDNNFIKRILEIYKFDMNYLDVNKINYVHMNDYKFGTYNKPLLLTINLQCCVAVYLYGNDFGFLAHINITKGNLSPIFFDFKNNKFLLSDLILEKLKNYCDFCGKYDGFYIGMVLGCLPYSDDYYIMKSIVDDMNNLIKYADFYGVNIKLNDRIKLPDFIMNSITNEFISPNVKIKMK